MEACWKRFAVLLGLSGLGAALGCGTGGGDADVEASLSALMDDGDASTMAPGAMARPAPTPPPSRFCPENDCAGSPLAFWMLDDCNAQSTELRDSAFTSAVSHPAFRAVAAACVSSVDGLGVQLAKDDDILYAPDQPDFVFDAGLTVAAWINPERVTGTQTVVRKRLDGTSSFLLAIDGKQLTFVLRLTSGRLVSVAAPIRAKRFTHVAATYDGRQALLYVDGAVAARAKAVGAIARGVGPIFVGNDADGRQLKGIVDDIWLNTLAAPPAVIAGLTCIRKAPVATLSPAVSAPQTAGATVPFDLSVTNPSSASCPVDRFQLFTQLPFPLSSDTFFSEVAVAPGATAHVTISVSSSPDAAVGSYAFGVFVENEASFLPAATPQATYVVGSASPACFGSPPATPLITGVPFGPAQGTFTFAATGLGAPVVTPVFGPDMSTQALQVSVNPGATTDLANNFLGFGMPFVNPPCLDARAFTGVRFTITGDLGTCNLAFTTVISEDNSTAFGPFGRCTAASCISPASGPLTTGTTVVHFADMTNGTPAPTVDAAALNGVQWTLTVPTDGVTAPCVANFTVSNVAFVNDTAPDVSFTFDTGTQGWAFNQFNGPPFTNIAVAPTGVAPALDFSARSGDPAPGALRMTAPFTAVDQIVDAVVGFAGTGIDLSGKTLHARVRLASGSFTQGGVQFHALSGPTFIFAGTFLSPDQLPLGVWVPMTIDLGAAAAGTPGFDPTQIVQIGVQFLSGFSGSGDVFQGSGDAVFEIDTVTD